MELPSIFKSQKITKSNLYIYDDIFPCPYSDWRFNEYIYYLKNIDNTIINVNEYPLWYLKPYIDHLKYKSDFKNNFPQFKKNLHKFRSNQKVNAKLGYCLFFNNLKKVFPIFKNNDIPFVFTLYPGGGFKIHENLFEQDLKHFFNSNQFRHVIVNMPYVYDYIRNKFKIPDNKISYIYGAPLSLPKVDIRINDKEKIKIVFSAHKYSANGQDKGFDVFNKVAKILEDDNRFYFTVLGGFESNDFLVHTNNINFKNTILPEKLPEEFSNHDIIISPNRSNILHKGAFDGFPTGSVVHAVNSNCLMMITDDLGNANSLGLIDGIDYILITTSVIEIVEKLKYLANNQNLIRTIANNGKEKLLKNFDISNQLTSRFNILKTYL